MVIDRIETFLLQREAEGMAQFGRWIDRYIRLPSGILAVDQKATFSVAKTQLKNILVQHNHIIASAGLSHGKEEAQMARGMHRFAAALPSEREFYEFFSPEEIMNLLFKRSELLAGDVTEEGLNKVLSILNRFLGGEYSRTEAEQLIAEEKKGIANRASNIVTTETTYFYNRARLVSFKQERVDYLQFSAILDKRTSTVCRSRHGLVIAMNDPNLPYNVPPLHGRCRSILRPIYSYVTPELITKERLDWAKAAALPKGWRTNAS